MAKWRDAPCQVTLFTMSPWCPSALTIIGTLVQLHTHSNTSDDCSRWRLRSGSSGANAILGHEATWVGIARRDAGELSHSKSPRDFGHWVCAGRSNVPETPGDFEFFTHRFTVHASHHACLRLNEDPPGLVLDVRGVA